ncbi:MAG: 2-oxo-4-hydroxy-4-carboxy-5-ureidoimidazoline decarboxylase [Usitatibacter sp.]
MGLTLAEVNALDLEEFVTRLGALYEHSPWVAREAWLVRPFASWLTLHEAMQCAVLASPQATQLGLVRKHPELLGRLAAAELTEASRGEQASAGLDRCTPDQRARMQSLNAAYRERFGFPFVVAVRGLNWQGIIDRLDARLANEADVELRTALAEIGRIAGFRLADLAATDAGPFVRRAGARAP